MPLSSIIFLSFNFIVKLSIRIGLPLARGAPMRDRTTNVTNVPVGARRSRTCASLKSVATISQPRAAPPRPRSARSGSVRASCGARCPIMLSGDAPLSFPIREARVLIRRRTRMLQGLGCDTQRCMFGRHREIFAGTQHIAHDGVNRFQRRMRREVEI